MAPQSEGSYRRARRSYGIAFRCALGLSTVSFLLASVYAHRRLSGITAAAATIEAVATPSIEHLAEARHALNGVARHAAALMASVPDSRPLEAKLLQVAINGLAAHCDAYLALELLPQEMEKWQAIKRDLALVVSASMSLVRLIEEAAAGEIVTRHYRERLDPAIEALDASIPPAIAHDAGIARTLAHQIRNLHSESLRMVVMLDAVSVALSIFSAFFVYGMFRRHARLEDSLVAELSYFSGRVAHDIKSPLSTIAMALQMPASDAAVLTRNALRRATRLVDDLLAYAQAGIDPVAGERADLHAVLADLEPEYRRIARLARIDFRRDCTGSGVVRCSEGVLTSLVENLLRNAIKYMGNSPTREVVARMRTEGGFIRFEVEDTGPGVPESIKNDLFKPFVRGSAKGVEGSGLGLATVKRLVDSHGGTVGTRMRSGGGAIFWFALPAARGDR